MANTFVCKASTECIEATRFSGAVISLWIFALKWKRSAHRRHKRESCFWILACILSKLYTFSECTLCARHPEKCTVAGLRCSHNCKFTSTTEIQFSSIYIFKSLAQKKVAQEKEIYFDTQCKSLASYLDLIPPNKMWLFLSWLWAPHHFHSNALFYPLQISILREIFLSFFLSLLCITMVWLQINSISMGIVISRTFRFK